MRLQRILVPVDFTRESELALEWAIRLVSNDSQSVIFLLHVLSEPPIPHDPLYERYWGECWIVKEWDEAKKKIEQWRQHVPSTISSVALTVKGDLAREVCFFCLKERIDLVVMTTHGRHGLTRVIKPNLSEKVVRIAPSPVLVLHLNQQTKSMLMSYETIHRTVQTPVLTSF